MQKLLIITPSIVRGGTEEYALQIGAAALAQQWHVTFACPHIVENRTLIADAKKAGLDCVSMAIAEQAESWREPRYKHALRFIETLRHVRRIRPDVVQLNLPFPNLSFGSILACAILNIPTVVIFHLTPAVFPLGPKRLRAYQWAKSRRQSWIAVSEFNRQIVSASFRIPLAEIRRIYNGIPLSNFSWSDDIHQQQRRDIRQQFGMTDNMKLIITVGRLHQQKGYDDLIPVIPHILKEFPDARFLWVGDGPQRNHLQQRLEEYGIASHVTFTGFRQDVSVLLHAADLFVFPTHFEGLPFAVLEAMACGAPVVSSRAASLPEIIEHGTHGLLFRTGDSCELLETIRWALRHPEQMQTMAQQALLRVQEFNQDTMITQTLGLLHEISHVSLPEDIL
ncbi:glycosyl transferase group 1 [Candidatus Moduliflexus flocculans]|uniref:Glycosyl transferase group 1 n=1 Tax=Candidatus Moduliflexus flocculans TaxID=1499966 RepID=A0A0S6VYU1_9BACT|nr:glycosyl transferase group 1 [Candidatus Moduliflexus flocculans]